MFYVIGLGLGDAEDITVKGLKIVQTCDRVYLENYTSILTVGKEALVKPNLKITYVVEAPDKIFLFNAGRFLWARVNIG